MNDNVATKGDVAELRGELGAVKAELKGDIGAVKAELWAVKWVLGFVLAIVPAMAARLFGVLWRSPPGAASISRRLLRKSAPPAS